jgi:transposase
MRRQGIGNRAISQALGVSERHTSNTWRSYLKDGKTAIELGKRGRRHGEQRTLSVQQEKELKNLVIDKTPEQLKLSFTLWTRDAVRLWIKKRYGIDMPIRTVGEYLKRWGFTSKKPLKRAYEQNPKAVRKWLDEEYPTIAVRAKEEGGEIHWADETGIESNEYSAKGYALKGRTPVLRLNVRKKHIGMISSVSNQGQVRFMMYRDAMHADLFITFLRRLIKDTGRKVFLIIDNLRTHHSKKVSAWLKDHEEEIEVFYLPAYSPELNPDEYLNNDLKGRIRSGSPARPAHS